MPVKSFDFGVDLRHRAAGNLQHVLIILSLFILLCPVASIATAADIEANLQARLEQSRSVVVTIQEKLLSGASVSSEITQLKSTAESIRVDDLLLQERFKLREEKVKALGNRADERHQVMVEGYKKALQEYLNLVDSIQDSDTASQAHINKLKALLDNLLPKKKRPILGTLPYKNLNYPAVEPSTAPSITPAYLGGNKAVSLDDTDSTPEAPISQEIAALAQSLKWSPVSIYEYVKNNIDTEWYWGCMKGAEDTLHQKSGNDCDQAALLTALLRASGFPTRYVRGTVQFFPDIERAKNLTGIDDPLKIAEFFQKAGIPYKPLIAGGRIANIQIEHVWVESQIPYANYRGAIIDEHGKTWLGLDTSIKVRGYTYNNPPDILSMMSFSTVRDEYLGFATAATPSTPFELNQTPLEYLQSRIDSELLTLNSQLSYTDFLRTKTLIPEVLNILPASMQFTLIKATNEYTALPDELIHKVKFIASDPATHNELFAITLPLYRLSNQPTAVSYEPETVEDQDIINFHGGMDNTPAYLVRLRPVLRINGERIIIAQDGLPMGGEYDLTVELTGAGGTDAASSGLRVEKHTNTMIIGNLAVIGIVAGKAVQGSEFTVQSEKDAGRLLYEEAINYVDRWNQAEKELASLLHLTIARPLPSVVTLGGMIDVTYLLDQPHGFTWKGVFIDADLRTIETVRSAEFGVGSEGERQQLFMQLSSIQGSILENKIFEDDFKVESISTAKLFQIVNQGTGSGGQGSGLMTIDKTNIDDLLPTLSLDDNIKEDMQNAINQGYQLSLPSNVSIGGTPNSELSYHDWSGIGYLKENPETGESGWMLSGMIAGGMTAWGLDKWPDVIKGILEGTYSEPAVYDPASARSIRKIASTDLQNATVGKPLAEKLQVKVIDNNQTPVAGVPVTFTVKAGGGHFDNNQDSMTVISNGIGVAAASFVTGTSTSANPAFMFRPGEEEIYYQQVGENIIDAALPSGTNLTTPFTAMGFPGAPHHLARLHGDETWGMPLSFAGFVSASLEDVHNNPISNVTVTFSVADPVQNPDHQCEWTTIDTTHKTYFTETGLSCIKGAPAWGTCGDTEKQELSIVTSRFGATAQVILGGMDNAIYTVTATSPSFSAMFKLYTYEIYSSAPNPCGGNNDPYRKLMTSYSYTSDMHGNNINAGKTGTTVPLKASMRYFLEQWALKDVACGIAPCNKVVGTRQYETTTVLTDPSMTFGQTVGSSLNGGVYTADYPLQAGKNEIPIKGTATITVKKTHMNCPTGCTTADEPLTQTDTATMIVYGVKVETQPMPMMLVNENGYLNKDQTITYTIEPIDSEYKAMTAYTFIYKDEEIVAQIPTETKGTGAATLSRGFQFDVNSKYEAEVVLNYGTGVEIKGNRVTIPVAQLRVLTDELVLREADEIKFSDGSDHSNGTKKYHIEIKSQSWLYSCETLTGRIVTRSTATATSGQPVSTPDGNNYASVYPLTFYRVGAACLPKIIDTVDGHNEKYKFILSNRPRTELVQSNINNTAVLYGGIGNYFEIEIGGSKKALPIDPVGVVVLAIDGLRQDVLYPPNEQKVNDPHGNYYVLPSQLSGLCEVLGGKEALITSCNAEGWDNKHIRLQDVTAVFPSITLASWASIFTGEQPKKTGVLGNEFFARDLYNSVISTNQLIPGMGELPSGMVTLGDGAFLSGTTRYFVYNLMPAHDYAASVQDKLDQSAPNRSLSTSAQTIYEWIRDEQSIQNRMGRAYNNPSACMAGGECRSAVFFNHYARGADWWGTMKLPWLYQLGIAIEPLGQAIKKAFGTPEKACVTLDETPTNEALAFLEKYYPENDSNPKKRFPALFTVYYGGPDHYAHDVGMNTSTISLNYTGYKDYFLKKTDKEIEKVIKKLKDLDEFDNKIFIIVADHGMTEMPASEEMTLDEKDENGNVIKTWRGETSCNLNVKGFGNKKVQIPEQANNNLHIWELGEVLKAAAEESGLYYKVLAAAPIAALFKDNSQNELPYGATSEIAKANVIAALNGPMAHIYLKSGGTWKNIPSDDELNKLAIVFKRILQEAGIILDVDVRSKLSRLLSSVDYILIRQSGEYKVFNGYDTAGNLVPPGDLLLLSESIYIKSADRIIGMNNIDRSGDIVLIFKDWTNDTQGRYTSGVACKSWHGSLNSSDSYVPLIVTYPGGNKTELEHFINNTPGCSMSQGCDGNWRVTDIIQSIIRKQYSTH